MSLMMWLASFNCVLWLIMAIGRDKNAFNCLLMALCCFMSEYQIYKLGG